MRKVNRVILLFCGIFIIAVCCAKAEETSYKDGVYVGEYGFVKVRVYVEEGKISDIEILHHGGGGEKYEDMVRGLTDTIIERQSVEVDGITGATVSSKNLKKAVENALRVQNESEEKI